MQIKEIRRVPFHGVVYNLGVKCDESYTVHGIKVSNCRGINVAILQDEDEKPAITGVPKSLREKMGDQVNELVQPKSPTNVKDSAAKSEIDKRNNK